MYGDYRNHLSTGLATFARITLRHLLGDKRSLPISLYNLFEKSRRQASQPSFSELLPIILDVGQEFTKCFLIVDAIDEFDIDNTKGTGQLFRELKKFAMAGFKVLVTGRNLPNAPWLSAPMVVAIETVNTGKDIKTFIAYSLHELEDDETVMELLEEMSGDEIAASLETNAHGMYVKAYYQVHTRLLVANYL